MKAGDVMTRKLVSIGSYASIAEMVRLMLDNRISGLPVIDDNTAYSTQRIPGRLAGNNAIL